MQGGHNLKYLLSMTQPYINYEEKMVADGGNHGLENPGSSQTSKKDSRKAREKHERMGTGES